MRWWDFLWVVGVGGWEGWSGGVWYVFWSLGGYGFGAASANGMDGAVAWRWNMVNIYISIPAQTHSLPLFPVSLSL